MSERSKQIAISSTPNGPADESGAALVELALVLPLFLFLLFGLIDFGRLGFSIVMARSAVDMAVRTAVVRPLACDDPTFPTSNQRGSDTTQPLPPFGTSCSPGTTGICAAPSPVSCTGSESNTTAFEIWNKIAPLMPFGTTIANLQFTYTYDPNLGFLGGPYVPTVTVALTGAKFQFVTPLGALAEAFAGGPLSFDTSKGIDFPTISAALPGEDLAEGTGG
ncbi:TadE/TadG family type IV pilus assembly protein [Solirhodobacter olei]|uniref:TadE/TadG family type IV pilus assembly protein n=1 Tax=Solirhodobacter olei TaxID=2493082 RepID=UPI000FDB939C|nr:TadE/TadG family type IV pilus assembly protein [Solirhodobacter olei]